MQIYFKFNAVIGGIISYNDSLILIIIMSIELMPKLVIIDYLIEDVFQEIN